MTRLEQLRVDAFLTLDDLAEKTGVNRKTIYNLERGHVARPTMRTLKPLAQFFEVPASSLLDDQRDLSPAA